MSFLSELASYHGFSPARYIESRSSAAVEQALAKDVLDMYDFAALLSPAAADYLELMAQRAQQVTRQHFGNVIFLFTPMYISNYCENRCRYCSFSSRNKIARKQLTLDEIAAECDTVKSTGIRHILVLTGESPRLTSFDYVHQAISLIHEHFASVSIEIYPLDQEQYKTLIKSGVDGLTIYQETYNRAVYTYMHEGGPKADYEFRLAAPERACNSNIRAVTLGPLLGLHDSSEEAFYTALHLAYLQRTYPSVEFSVSFPRIRPLAGEFQVDYPVGDRRFVQILLAFRLFQPSMGITLSTRESAAFRNNLIPLGITKMSAGVSTSVGGHSGFSDSSQFEIDDTRSVEEMKRDLHAHGFQPVMHDWYSRLTHSL